MAESMAAPAPAEDPYDPRRCDYCGGMLHSTLSTGEPQQQDHFEGCEFFAVACLAAQYAKSLAGASSGSASSSRGGQKYLRKNAKELARAALTANPVAELEKLAVKYDAEYEKGIKQAAYAQLLSDACQALARCTTPSPSPLLPDSPEEENSGDGSS